MTNDELIYRIIDANLNRTREGLRVCEDIARFVITNKRITEELKSMRHSVTKSTGEPLLKKSLLARDIKSDYTKFIDYKRQVKFSYAEFYPEDATKRSIRGSSILDILLPNIGRVKESLRVLEECFKVIDEGTSRKYRKLRFRTYDVEKRFAETFRRISSNR